jgi:hypothetical protein
VGRVLRPLYRWSLTDGLKRLDLEGQDEEDPAPDATQTLLAIKQHAQRGIYLMCDFHPYLRYAMTLRLTREIVARQGSLEHTLVLIAPEIELPPELADAAVRFAFSPPDEMQLKQLVRDEAAVYARENGGRKVKVEPEALQAMVRNLRGLMLPDARRIARHLIFRDGAIGASDLPELAKLKFELLNKNGLLRFEYDVSQFQDVAGLGRLKTWVAQRRAAYQGAALPPGLDPPKGLLLLGVQGCGKSLAAKAIAGGFGVPLVRLDFGSMYDKFHGETERNLRESLKSAEAIAPCVLWIDEIEKGLATSSSDDGVSKRVLGYLLTWMSERKSQVFLVATANQVDELPAELLRKGRFDEIFFVDLPGPAVRAELFRLHCQKRRIEWESFSIDTLVAATEGYSGAEIEQVVVAGLYAALGESKPLGQKHLEDSIRATRPLSVLMAEQVSALRAWALPRTVPAD